MYSTQTQSTEQDSIAVQKETLKYRKTSFDIYDNIFILHKKYFKKNTISLMEHAVQVSRALPVCCQPLLT